MSAAAIPIHIPMIPSKSAMTMAPGTQKANNEMPVKTIGGIVFPEPLNALSRAMDNPINP
jgi:hypothetical protein